MSVPNGEAVGAQDEVLVAGRNILGLEAAHRLSESRHLRGKLVFEVR